MSWVQDMFPWLTSNLQAMNQRVASLKDCKAMHTLRLLMVFVQDHPIMSLFLAMLMTLCCLPIIVILAFASSSSVLISLSALVVLGGTFLVALFSFLVVLSPILVSGGILAVVLYISFGFIMRMVQFIQRLNYIMSTSRRSRIRRLRLLFKGRHTSSQ